MHYAKLEARKANPQVAFGGEYDTECAANCVEVSHSSGGTLLMHAPPVPPSRAASPYLARIAERSVTG